MGKITEAILYYLSAVDTSVAQSGEAYLDLAGALDQASYPQPAVIAYRKAWMAFEAGYNLRGVKAEGTGLLTLANIRDSIVRLGGQVPSATSLRTPVPASRRVVVGTGARLMGSRRASRSARRA